MENDFGFTNDDAQYKAALAYREAAVADGWTCEQLYDSEPVEASSKHTKDGWVMFVMSRTKSRTKEGKWKYEAKVSIWGPDGLAIAVHDVYSWEALQAALKTCNNCGKTDVDTQRYGFAGRCCSDCLPEMKKQHEKPGWCD